MILVLHNHYMGPRKWPWITELGDVSRRPTHVLRNWCLPEAQLLWHAGGIRPRTCETGRERDGLSVVKGAGRAMAGYMVYIQSRYTV